jgi:hypothetical protein
VADILHVDITEGELIEEASAEAMREGLQELIQNADPEALKEALRLLKR